VLDRVTEQEVRRVNVIVYANYGEPNARIVHGRDHDFPDLRTLAQNRVIETKVKELAEDAKRLMEERETGEIENIKALLREYYLTKDEAAKRQFEAANTLHPFLFSRAWRELKEERSRPGSAAPPAAARLEPVQEVAYPLDPQLREQVIDIERVISELGHDVDKLKQAGTADDILLQTCRKLVQRAREAISGGAPASFNPRRLDKTRTSLLTTWRQVKSLLGRARG
jgi:hypothetical protein